MATPIMQPEDWKMRWARPPHAQAHPVHRVYVHQTAGLDPVEEFPTGDDRPQDAFFALNEYAINGKGYSAVDYSMLVHTGPSLRTTIGIARGEWVPAATLDDNTGSKAICMLGWFGPPDSRYPWTSTHAREPFEQELDAVAEAFVHGVKRGWIAPDAEVLGHRDNPKHPKATACPGDWLYAKLPVIRTKIQDLLNPPEDDDMPAVFWKDERYQDVFQTSPCVHYADKTDVPQGTPIQQGRHHRKLRSLATQCGITSVSDVHWVAIPVSSLPDTPD